jgi:hypothetical protein
VILHLVLVGYLYFKPEPKILAPDPVPDICDTGVDYGADSCRKLVVDMDVEVRKPEANRDR